MLLPLLVIAVALYFALAIPIARRIFRGNRRKAWTAAIAGAIVIFAGDHLVGLAYALLWVRAVPQAPALPIVTDSLALEADFSGLVERPRASASPEVERLNAYAMQMVSPEYWVDKGYPMAGLVGSYAKVEAIVPSASGEKVFELAVVADERNPACAVFFSFPPEEQKKWRAFAATGLANGENARCVAITAAPQVKSTHLYRASARKGSWFEGLVGISEVSMKSVLELRSRRILAEYRSMTFSGGWVKRTFWTSFSTGMTTVRAIATPGPLLTLRPASRQRVL